jgi:Ca2+-binding RTX toxin-like protein
MIYDVTDPANAFYVGYEPVTSQDYAPEVLTFVSAADSPTGEALVLSANEASGTITLYSVVPHNFEGTPGNDLLDGTTGADTITGLAGNDTLNGDEGDDLLVGGLGNDVLHGDGGTDTASYADATRGVKVDLSLATAQATNGAGKDTLDGIENLVGSDFADKLTGDGVANLLVGGAGNDKLDGGTGADAMDGGLGNDKYWVDDLGDLVVEGSALGGVDWVYASVDYTLDLNVEKLTLLAGTGDIDGTGNDLDNILFGNDGANVLNGGAGHDVLTGGLDADTFLLDVLGASSADKDVFKDFISGTDTIEISVSAFASLGAYGLGELDPGELTFGAKATAAGQHLIYNTGTGGLFYDADGVGGAAQIQIAALTGHPTLNASDITLIG